MLTTLVEFIVIAIPVLHCYIYLPLLRVLSKNGRYRTTVLRHQHQPIAYVHFVTPVIYSILLDIQAVVVCSSEAGRQLLRVDPCIGCKMVVFVKVMEWH